MMDELTRCQGVSKKIIVASDQDRKPQVQQHSNDGAKGSQALKLLSRSGLH